MRTSTADDAILTIEQRCPVKNMDGIYHWQIHWKLCLTPGRVFYEHNLTLQEPFIVRQYEEIANYLDESLDDNAFDQSEADKISNKIDEYRTSLFRGLELQDHIYALRGRCLEIHVWADPKIDKDPRSIHSIQWEQLEDLQIWGMTSQQRVRCVTVCRHVHTRIHNDPQSASSPPDICRDDDGTFDVLLVVARPHVHDKPETARSAFSILNPGTVRSVLVLLQEELRIKSTPPRLRLEVVRPGCYEELEDHLWQRSQSTGGRKPYHLIHFDMHGGVTKGRTPKAYLEFNKHRNGSNTLDTDHVYADKLAILLRKYKISCVILNACKSAVAHAGPSANLSSVFLRHGIPAVLAMSHNMHDSVSKRFYSRFYNEFLVRGSPMSIAASRARRELYVDRTRWSYGKEAEVSMQDWFIPVVYTSSQDPHRLFNTSSWVDKGMISFADAEDLFSSVIAIAIIFYLWSKKLCHGIEHETFYCVNFSASNSALQLAITMLMALIVSTSVQMMLRRRHYWKIRQRLRVLAEDRQNVLRIEGDLRKQRIIFFHSEEDVEEQAHPFLNALAAIWERTHFVAFGGAIDAEWFVQPRDLTYGDNWRLWMKACTNSLCLWVYNLGHHHVRRTRGAKSVIIIENLDVLYPEEEVLKEMQYYASAQRRLEKWLRTRFAAQTDRVSPYLMLTALRGRALGENVSKWLKDGPGRCGVLDSTAMTLFAKTSQRFVDPTNSTFETDNWYDWGMSWFCGDVPRPSRKRLIFALLDLLK